MSQLDHIYDRINDDVEVINRIQTEESEVQKYYAGKTLFITGATGFMGKCLLEKLLRSCPDIKHIYILLRERKNITVSERLRKYFQSDIFEPLYRQNPDFPKKITAIKGELDLDNLGLQKDDKDILIKETDVIIHNAANVKFNERVNVLLRINVLGTKKLLDLACQCKKLESFMYVSTAFSHCYKLELEERLFPSPVDLETVYHIIETDTKTEKGMSSEAVKTLIGKYPNTYTFTKGIAEDVIRQYSEISTFACGIFRPSVVIPTANEPLVGWTDNINGTMPLIIGTGIGLLHAAYYLEHPFENVPCDMTINALLVVTSNLKKQSAIEQGVVVYNYSSAVINPLSTLQMYKNITSVIEPRHRSSKSVWLNFFIICRNYWIFWFFHILFHFIPACLVDLVLLLLRKKPKTVSIFMKLTRNLDLIFYLSNTDWRIHVDKTDKVITQLNSVDKELFFCDLRELDWDIYCLNMWKGIKHYLLKESLNNDDGARRYYLLWSLHYGLVSMLLFTFTYYMIRLVF